MNTNTTTAFSLDPKTAKVLPWIVAIAFFMQMLDNTILNTALPAMAQDLGESPLRMQSVVIAYTLTVALFIPASGWLAERFGVQRVFSSAVALFTVGSLACALSPTLLILAVARVLQGIGGAMMMPVGRLLILRAYPRTDLVRILSFVSVPGLIGPLVGPVLGGWLVQYASWHWIFLINLPVGLLGCFVSWRYMPDMRRVDLPVFDWGGFLLFGAAMLLISISLQGLGELHMPHARVILLLVIGLAALAAYWLHAARAKKPLFSLRLFHTHSFAVGILGNIFSRLGSSGMPYLTPLLLQLGLGYSPSKAGMSMIPLGLAAMSVKPFAQFLIKRMGYRWMLSTNTAVLGLLIASFSLIDRDTPYVWMLILFTLFGAVNSMQFTAMNTITVIDLKDEDAGSGNSLLSVVMQLSISLGVAVCAALLSGFSPASDVWESAQILSALHATYLCIGSMSIIAALIFFQLKPQDGQLFKRLHEHH